MAIVQGQTTVFKLNLLKALENFAVGTPYTYKIALYNALADLSSSTTAYTTTNEITGTGYTAGGNTLVISISPTSGTNNSGIPTAYISFNNTSWTNATFTCRGALIYNSTVSGNPSVGRVIFAKAY
jgi:hypothetical protein